MSTPAFFSPTISQISLGKKDYIGWCRICGHEHDSIEPDAENYHCEECDSDQVFGAEEFLMNGWVAE